MKKPCECRAVEVGRYAPGSVFKPPFQDGLDEDRGNEGDGVHMCLLNAKKTSRDG